MLVYSKIIYSFLRDTSQLWREDAYLAPHFIKKLACSLHNYKNTCNHEFN